MEQTFTTNDLIRYIYEETGATESVAIESALDQDWLLKEKYYQLLEAHDSIDMALLAPCSTTLDLIMEHAKKTALPAFVLS